jgi:hypothetical protein
LFETIFVRLGFVKSSACPYCGTTIRLARDSLFFIFFGVLSLGTGVYCLTNHILAGRSLLCAIMLGVGATSLLLGLILVRFQAARPRNDLTLRPSRLYFPHA